jgi:GrpB-like predicted nucleotidyltransferase (UPF0157 family)
MKLRLSDHLQQTVADVLVQVRGEIKAVLPGVAVHHIGATAIRGALTKGDLDVLIRVEQGSFAQAIEALRTIFLVKQPENWDQHFASFGSDIGYAMPVGVQLVVQDSEADFFIYVRDYLGSHPEALELYNRVKSEAADRGADEYWSAKNEVLTSIIALKPRPDSEQKV